MLDIKGISITSKVLHNLVDVYTCPLYMSCVQKKFKWEETTVKLIAWDSLSLALIWIDRPVITTKISNDLLRTKLFLFNSSQSSKNTCPICKSEETSEHLLRCNHKSRVKWRWKLVKDLHRKLTNTITGYVVIKTMAIAAMEWLDTGRVCIQQYPKSFINVLL